MGQLKEEDAEPLYPEQGGIYERETRFVRRGTESLGGRTWDGPGLRSLVQC